MRSHSHFGEHVDEGARVDEGLVRARQLELSASRHVEERQ